MIVQIGCAVVLAFGLIMLYRYLHRVYDRLPASGQEDMRDFLKVLRVVLLAFGGVLAFILLLLGVFGMFS